MRTCRVKSGSPDNQPEAKMAKVINLLKQPPHRILDFGCGAGRMIRWLGDPRVHIAARRRCGVAARGAMLVIGVLHGVSAAQWTDRMAGFHRGLVSEALRLSRGAGGAA
jgi:hypothetical protein